MKVYFLVLLIIIMFIWLNKREKEQFVNNQDVFNTLEHNWDGILKTTDFSIKSFKNSSQFSVSNIIKLIRINDSIYNYKNSIQNQKIIYDYSLDEHINSHSTSIIIGNSFDTNKNSNSYGFLTTFNPEEELHNFAYIGIGFNSTLDLNKINNLKNERKNPDRKVLEIFSIDNSPNEFSKYFNYEKQIKFIGIFENQNNLDFINNLPIPKKFNLVDFYGNRILTRCTVDYPYCNIELPAEKNVRGRNGYVVGKYNPKKLGVTLLTENNELKKYDTLKNCNLERNDNKELIIDDNRTRLLDLNDDILENDKEFIKKNFIKKTGLNCKQHSSKFIKDYYYGGLNSNDEKYKCYSNNNSECKLFKQKKNCDSEIEKVISESPSFEEEKLIDIDPKSGIYPFTIKEEDKIKYDKYNKIGCFKTQEKEVFCKHIHNNILSDLITFNLNDCIEKNAEDILKNREIIDLRSIPGLKEYTRDQQIEYYKNKLFIEPYLEESKEDNRASLINNIPYFMKLKNNYEDGQVKTICEIIKNNKEGYSSLAHMKSNIDEKMIKLQKTNKIYIRINKDKKLIFSILNKDDNVLSDYIVDKKLEGEFGEEINFYISTNNKNIFENPFYSENLNGVIVPYLSKIDINFLD